MTWLKLLWWRIIGKIAGHPLFIDDEPIHLWFELSYAQYLVIPRSILQSMPTKWQRNFVWLMGELDETFEWRRSGCWVKFKDRRGRFMVDELADYNRGRRTMPPDLVKELTEEHNQRFFVGT
jgi:hypothetical protein